MNNTTTVHRNLAEIQAELDATDHRTPKYIRLRDELLSAVRAKLAIPSDADELAAQAERAARTMAPPVPGVTVNAGYTVRAVIHAGDAVPGLLAAWWVAAERDNGSEWVTWNAYEQDGSRAGKLSYDGGHYFPGPYPSDNRRGALADLAVRAGLAAPVARHVADEIAGWTYAEREDRRMVSRLRRYLAGR